MFISGGSQGLGASIARAAAREGAQAVVVTGHRREPGEKLVAELAEQGATARFVHADVSDAHIAVNPNFDHAVRRTHGRRDEQGVLEVEGHSSPAGRPSLPAFND